MLQRCDDVTWPDKSARITLQTQYRLHPHLRDQIRIFSVGFFNSSPARLPGDVHYRRQYLMHADRAAFGPDRIVNLPHQFWIPSAGQGNGRWKQSCPRGHGATGAFGMNNGRYGEAGLGGQDFLEFVVEVDFAFRGSVGQTPVGYLAHAILHGIRVKCRVADVAFLID